MATLTFGERLSSAKKITENHVNPLSKQISPLLLRGNQTPITSLEHDRGKSGCHCSSPLAKNVREQKKHVLTPRSSWTVKVQMKTKADLKGDAAEREAEEVAQHFSEGRLTTSQGNGKSCESCQYTSSALKLSPLFTPIIPSQLQSLIPGQGNQLARPVRERMERGFGYDLSHVRVHTDKKSSEAATRMGARAFTLGNHIVFNRGEFKPEAASGERILVHELTHVLQQAKVGESRPQLLSDRDCAKDCSKKDGTDVATGKYSITIYADKEGPFLLLPLTYKVGHAWLKLQDDNGNYWTYGFWPKKGFDGDNPSADVDGCIHHPDQTTHNNNNPATQTFELTAIQFSDAFKYAVDTCLNRPKYNLFGLQCTEFVKRTLSAAGKGSAGGFGLIWESPNALASWIKTNALVVGANVTGATSANNSAGQGSLAFDFQYRHQFYSLLGQKLRLYGVGQAELGKPIKAGSLGAGLELNTQKIYLPQLYLEAGG
ncbi:eCIS core domain-containing protein [Veronia pacifica]|nr:DUF4157 domain-containing protein [Veronia pacifica]ODA35168.1 hypothetical protein A8L45_04435 [Veronia pacifica]